MKANLKFTIYKEVEVDKVETTKNDKGEEVKITKKIKEKQPHTFFIAKPTRALLEDSELYYNSIYWKCVKDYNIQPSIQLQKRYLDDGGVLSSEQKKEYHELNLQFFEKQAKYHQLRDKADKTEEEVKETDLILNEVVDLLGKLQTFENQMGDTLYQNTAESIARDRTATWWMLNLSYEDLGNNKFKSIFGEGSYADKLKAYDAIEEREDEFELESVKKLFLATSLWYFKKVQNQDEFELMLKLYENKELVVANETVKTLESETKNETPNV